MVQDSLISQFGVKAYLKNVWQYCIAPKHLQVNDSLSGVSANQYQYSFRNLIVGYLVLFIIQMVLLQVVALAINLEELPHAIEQFSMEFSSGMIFFLGVIFAPLIEECIFRLPLRFFTKGFPIAFYIFTLGFALLHGTNFQLETSQYWMVPLLVIPQTIIGFYLAFVRMHYSIWHAIGIHAFNNLIPISLLLIGKSLGIEIQ